VVNNGVSRATSLDGYYGHYGYYGYFGNRYQKKG